MFSYLYFLILLSSFYLWRHARAQYDCPLAKYSDSTYELMMVSHQARALISIDNNFCGFGVSALDVVGFEGLSWWAADELSIDAMINGAPLFADSSLDHDLINATQQVEMPRSSWSKAQSTTVIALWIPAEARLVGYVQLDSKASSPTVFQHCVKYAEKAQIRWNINLDEQQPELNSADFSFEGHLSEGQYQSIGFPLAMDNIMGGADSIAYGFVNDTPFALVPFSFSTSEIAGSFRWVTTYIARWDPKGEWPSDWEVDLVWNQALTIWDDVPLNLTEVPPTVTLRTPTLSFDITDVDSEIAKSLTDDEWGPYTNAGQDDSKPEVPLDAVITISFNFPVNLTLLNGSFVATQDGQDTDINALVFPCVTPYNKFIATVQDGYCAKLTLQGDLDVAGQYMLSLPQGVKYHPLSGPLRESLEYVFYGLKEFPIPFLRQGSITETENEVNRIGLEYRRFDIWLLHGLAESVTLADLKSLITLQKVPFIFKGMPDASAQSLNFELELINKGRLQLTAQVEPSTKYVISMQASSNVTDGFGLPLKLPLYPDDEFEDLMVFIMKRLDEVFQTFSSNVIFEDIDGQDYQWPLFSRNTVSEFNKLSAWVVTEKNLMDVLVDMYSYYDDRALDLKQYLVKPDVVLQGSKDALIFEIQQLESKDLLFESGAFVTQECCQRSRFFQGVWRTDAADASVLFKTTLNFVNFAIYFGTVSSPVQMFSNSDLQIFTIKDRQLVRPGETLKIKGAQNTCTTLEQSSQLQLPQCTYTYATSQQQPHRPNLPQSRKPHSLCRRI